MSKTIVIVGATGKVGSKTAQNLLAQGHTVRLVARTAEKLAEYTQPNAEIHAGNANDADFLTGVLTGADVALLMISTDYNTPDVPAYQDAIGEAQIAAIKASGIKNILFLSSVGGHTEENTGIVAGLARQEVRLKAIEGLNLYILRPTYFMENLFANMPLMKSMGINGSTIAADATMSMIATNDIAQVAAYLLNGEGWTGTTTQAILGARNYTMAEVTTILGTAIGEPDMPYMVFPAAAAKDAMMGAGLSASMADAYIGLFEGINLGVFNTEVRNDQSTTPTTVEEFAHIFAAVYNAEA